MPDQEFSQLQLCKEWQKHLNQLGYQQMTEVQKSSLPAILQGKDLIVQAETGSGKTAAFGIGCLHQLEVKRYKVQILVLCPTRELAKQVAQELRKLARIQPNTKILSLCGGEPIGPQIGSLEHGAHIVIGTPGRLKDHLRKATLDLSALKTLVLDEADRMLDMGFQPDISTIAEATPSQRQTLLFSATYPETIAQLSADFQTDPINIKVEPKNNKAKIQQQFFNLEPKEKTANLLQLIRKYKPETSIIFCNTKRQCQELLQELKNTGLSVAALQGDMEQKARDQVLVTFANRSINLLIATDVAARGIDVKNLDLVINFDLPSDPEVYVHRIGRTGRAGKSGIALSLSSSKEQYKIDRISQYTKQEISYKNPPTISAQEAPIKLYPSMHTLCLSAGRKQKIRAGDIVGALTRDKSIKFDQLGKIDIFDFVTYIAVERALSKQALTLLEEGGIKGRKIKVRRLRG